MRAGLLRAQLHHGASLEQRRAADLEGEIEQLRQDLVFYGNHLTSCAYLEGARPCSCGLLAAINRIPRAR